jgi:hypothetical protein
VVLFGDCRDHHAPAIACAARLACRSMSSMKAISAPTG